MIHDIHVCCMNSMCTYIYMTNTCTYVYIHIYDILFNRFDFPEVCRMME